MIAIVDRKERERKEGSGGLSDEFINDGTYSNFKMMLLLLIIETMDTSHPFIPRQVLTYIQTSR